jgi:genome maintenance exonuclease 1
MKLFNHVGGLTPIELDAIMVDGKRLYPTPEGQFTSVTTVISSNREKMAGIARWRERVGEEKANNISSRSTNRGTKYHSIVEDYLKNALDLKKYQKFSFTCVNVSTQ